MRARVVSQMLEAEVPVLPDIPDHQYWWLALVQLEKAKSQTLFNDEEEGAYVWVAAVASEQAEVDKLIQKAAKAEGLRVVSIEDHTVVEDLEEIEEADEHLAGDVLDRETGQRLSWGTWHVYYGDGEA
jgi:nucleotide-binding universal stress UspA family protein